VERARRGFDRGRASGLEAIRRVARKTWSIRTARPDDAEQLAGLGATLFREAYEATHPEPTLSEYVRSSFAIERVAQTLDDPASTILVVSTEALSIGYAELHEGPPTAPTTLLSRPLPGAAPMEIVRFYVAEQWHGHGVAHDLMRASEERAREGSCDMLWLQAWTQADRALRFYRKIGFDVYGTAVFTFGPRTDTDLILARGLTPDQSS
jgi:GNAT superfamily N-acetyltransferase